MTLRGSEVDNAEKIQWPFDIEQIKQLKHRYCAYCDEQYDPDGIASLFTEDGVWDGGPFRLAEGPERDDPDVMRRYLEEKFPRFTGLSGTPEQIESAKEAFKVFARRKPDPSDPDGYAVPHTAITYLIDPDGSYATHWVETKTADVILTDLKQRLT